MTKYILHGGSAQRQNPENTEFFKEILKDTPQNVSILLVHFASLSDDSLSNFEKDTAQFDCVKENKILTFPVAEESKFLEQIKSADVIYFGGGTTPNLLAVLKNFDNLKDLFAGKIVAGESAGANALSTYCYSKSGGVMKCLGIIPIKTIPHFEKVGSQSKLQEIEPDLELLELPSFQYKVYWR